MPQSLILRYGLELIKSSKIIRWVSKQADSKEELKYSSTFTLLLQKPTMLINDFFVVRSTYLSKLFLGIDLKSVILFVFILSQVIFPGFGTENAGTALLPTSPASSIANRYGFVLNLITFTISLIFILFIFIKDLSKQSNAFKFSRLEIILLLFVISLEISTLFSTYLSISFPWLIKVSRGLFIYFIFSRLTIKKANIIAICVAFMAIIYVESALSLLQYINGGFLGVPIETAEKIIDPQRFYLQIENTLAFRPSGTLSQPNYLSFFLAFSTPFSLVLIFQKNNILRLLAIGGVALSIIVSFITLSRWGTITLFFSITIFLFLKHITNTKKLNINVIRGAAIIILTSIIFLALNNNLFSRFLYFDHEETSLFTRLELITQATYVFIHNPLLGIGGGTFPRYLVNFDFTPSQVSNFFPDPVHNFSLLMLSEVGIFPFALILILTLYFVTSFFKAIRITSLLKNPLTLLFVSALFTSFISYLFNGLWELRSISERLMILVWMSIGLYTTIIRKVPK